MFGYISIMLTVIAIFIGIMYWCHIREVGKKAAWRDIKRGVTILAIAVIIGFAFFRISPISLKDSVTPYLIVLFFTVLLVLAMGLLLWNLKQGGTVLLNLGKSLQKKIMLAAGCMAILNGIFLNIVFNVQYNAIDLQWAWYVTWYISGLLCILSGLTHNKIKEGGILFSDRFLRWERITSYEWEGNLGLTLTLKIKHRIPLLRTLSIPVQSSHKDAVEQLLIQNVTDDQE